jgi:hypothetical protein
MSGQTSFKIDILPLFTERDIKGMSRAFDLTDYKAVKAHAQAIRDRIRGIGGPSCHRPHRSATAPGRNQTSTCSDDGSQTTARPEAQPGPAWSRLPGTLDAWERCGSLDVAELVGIECGVVSGGDQPRIIRH